MDLIDLAKRIWNHLRARVDGYSDEELALIKTTAHAVDRARNRFSEAHVEGEARERLATHVSARSYEHAFACCCTSCNEWPSLAH